MQAVNLPPAASIPVAWTSPAGQTQSAAGVASVTFSAPTGGTGSYSYAPTLTKPVGSSATLSGSGLGPYTWTSDVQGLYRVELVATDGRGVSARAIGDVALDLADPPLSWSNPDPTLQTSAALASHTFSAPTGGTGPYSYSATLVKKPVGSSTTLSGSGLGAYTLTTDVQGVYEVRNVVTDSVGITQASTWVISLDSADPPITWSAPATQLKTVAGAESVTFPAASGGTGSISYSGATLLEKPVGSSASLSGSGLGAYTFTTDVAGNYVVRLTATDSVGITQTSYGVVTLDLTGAAAWETLIDIDLVGANTQSGLGTNGSYTLVNATDTPAGQNVTLDVRNQDATNPPTVATLTNGVGLEVTLTPSSTSQQQKNFAFRVDNIPGVTFPDPDIDELCIDVFFTPTSLASNTDSIIGELAQANPPDGSSVAYGGQLYRTSGTDYRMRTLRRATSTATLSTGQTVKTSLPTTWNQQFFGMGRAWVVRGQEQSSLLAPNAPTYVGDPGCASRSASDAIASDWGTPLYVVVDFIAHTNAQVVSGIITRIVVRRRNPAI